jgi:hypothetical protein
MAGRMIEAFPGAGKPCSGHDSRALLMSALLNNFDIPQNFFRAGSGINLAA